MSGETVLEGYELSPQQARVWSLSRREGSPRPGVCASVSVRGPLSLPRLERALAAAVARFDIFRIALRKLPGMRLPLQTIGEPAPGALQVIDLRALSAYRQQDAVSAALEPGTGQTLDSDGEPYLRPRLFCLAAGRHLLVLCAASFIADRETVLLLLQSTVEAYAEPDQAPEEPPSYLAVAQWLNDLRDDEDEDAAPARSFWREQLQTMEIPRLAFHGRTGLGHAVRPVFIPYSLEPDFSREVTARFGSERLTPVLLAAWSALLSLLIRCRRLTLGLSLDGRTDAELARVPGPLARVLPLSLDPREDLRFADLLDDVQSRTQLLEAHQDRFSWNGQYLDAPSVPVFSVGFERERAVPELRAGKTAFSLDRTFEWREPFDLNLVQVGDPERIRVVLGFNHALFSRDEARLLLRMWAAVLKQATANPRLPLRGLALMDRLELRGYWRTEPNGLGRTPGTLYELFAHGTRQNPAAVALVIGDRFLCYAALETQASATARLLLENGCRPGDLVGVCLEPGRNAAVAVLAILKIGAAYLPLDPGYPVQRLAFILEDASPAMLLTVNGLMPELSQTQRTLYLDRIQAPAARLSPAAPVPDEGLAYIIYTSGSTGKPKGAMVAHRGAANCLCWMQRTYGLTGSDRFLHKTPLNFDPSVWELFWTWSAGAVAVAVPAGRRNDYGYLAEKVEGERITAAYFVASMLGAFLDRLDRRRGRTLKHLICGGESLPVSVMSRCLSQHSAALHHSYGPTETAIAVCEWKCTPSWRGGVPPIGRPIAATALYVLDRELRCLPVWIEGELAVGGIGVGPGYWRRPGRTAARFVPDALGGNPGQRLYLTGDRVRFLADGNLQFQGRTDTQVKLKGYRIEPGEVEAALTRHPDVREAVAMLRELRGEPRLVAYAVPRPGHSLELGPIRTFLAGSLPDPMLPSALVVLNELPKSPSGKLDRNALPQPDPVTAAPDSPGLPRTSVERAIADVWRGVLGLERVGIHDNFFALGGDSVLGLQVAARLNRQGLHLMPRQLFEHQTIAELAEFGVTSATSTSPVRIESGPVPLTPIQARFFRLVDTGPHHWNQSLFLAPAVPISATALDSVLNRLIERHDALRLRFRTHGETVQQRVAHPGEASIRLRIVDLSGLPSARRAASLTQTAARFQTGLDLAAGPLFYPVLFRLGVEGGERLLLAFHHLAIDAVSWRIFLEEAESGYLSELHDQPPEWGGASVSFSHWARCLSEWGEGPDPLAEAGFWEDIAGRNAYRPNAETAAKNLVSGERTLRLRLERETTAALLSEACRAFNTSVEDVLLAALVRAFHRVRGDQSLVLELEGHGREDFGRDLDLTGTMGWFTTQFPVAFRILPEWDDGDLLVDVKERLRAVPRRGLGFGILCGRGDDPELASRLAAGSVAELSFNYIGRLDRVAEGSRLFRPAGEEPGPLRSPGARRWNRWELSAAVVDGTLGLEWTYHPALDSRERSEPLAATLAAAYLDALRRMIAYCQAVPVPGFTPADFPLAKLSRGNLDELMAEGVAVEDIYGLSPMQEGMLYHCLCEPQSSMYLGQMSYTLHGRLDRGALKRAWSEVMRRHPVLRTRFLWEGLAEPVQVVCAHVPLPWREEDWSGLSDAARADRLETFLERDRDRGFVLSEAPLMRLALCQLGDEAFQLTWTAHHLVSDGWSCVLVLREVAALYDANRGEAEPRTEPVRPYAHYIAWLRGRERDGAERFWRRELEGFAGPLSLPGERGQGANGAPPQFEELHIGLDAEETAALTQFARNRQLTVNTLAQGAWALLLHRLSGAEDLVFGAVVSGRPSALDGVERMIGLFINTLPVRVRIPSEQAALSWLRDLQDRQAKAREFEYAPLVQIQSWSRVPSGSPLFETILVFENFPAAPPTERDDGLHIPAERSFERNNYPFALLAMPGNRLSFQALYDARRFPRARIDTWLRHFCRLLKGLATYPEWTLPDISLIPEAGEAADETPLALERDQFTF